MDDNLEPEFLMYSFCGLPYRENDEKESFSFYFGEEKLVVPLIAILKM
jgi:hypothetical protein